jgi:rRNA maturation endonuclease Nob1
MAIRKWLGYLLPGSNVVTEDDGPAFRCLRCGAEFERQYDTCTECGNRFVARVGEE